MQRVQPRLRLHPVIRASGPRLARHCRHSQDMSTNPSAQSACVPPVTEPCHSNLATVRSLLQTLTFVARSFRRHGMQLGQRPRPPLPLVRKSAGSAAGVISADARHHGCGLADDRLQLSQRPHARIHDGLAFARQQSLCHAPRCSVSHAGAGAAAVDDQDVVGAQGQLHPRQAAIQRQHLQTTPPLLPLSHRCMSLQCWHVWAWHLQP
jgi:hypothetical protein